jgi:uncharacterized membrane protein
MNTFSIEDSIKFGWRTFNERRILYMGAAALVFAVSIAMDTLEKTLRQTDMSLFYIIAVLASVAISVLMSMGQVNFALRAHDHSADVSLKDLWAPNRFFPYLAASILGGLFVVLGLILLIVPGIIFSLMIMFSAYLVIDKSAGPLAALKESGRITKGHRWKLLGFVLALLGINILGFLALFIGLLVSVPISWLATAKVYRTLQHGA